MGQALVLAAISGLCRETTAQNVNAVAGAVLAHSLAQTEGGAEEVLASVVSVFDSQPSLLSSALDGVVRIRNVTVVINT